MTCPRGDAAENFSSNFSSSVVGVLRRDISYFQAVMQFSVNINTNKIPNHFTFICFYFFVATKGVINYVA